MNDEYLKGVPTECVEKWRSIFSNMGMTTEEDIFYDNIGDILEYGNITDDEAITLCNEIIDKSISENDDLILEAMYHAIYTGVMNRNIGDRLHTDIIAGNLDRFNEEVLDYIVDIFAFTGDKAYVGTIQKLGQQHKNLDIDDALSELNYYIAKKANSDD